MPTNYLDIGSRLVLIYGVLSVAFGIVVPVAAHLAFPSPFVYVREDELYTGVSWSLILATSPELGLWITYLADTGRGMMIALGILTTAMALRVLVPDRNEQSSRFCDQGSQPESQCGQSPPCT